MSALTELGVFGSAARIVYPASLTLANVVLVARLWRVSLKRGPELAGRICIAAMVTLTVAAMALWLFVYPDGAMRDAVELPELLYLAGAVLAWSGFMLLHAAHRVRRAFDVRVFLDVAILGTSGLALAWYFLIKPYSTVLQGAPLPVSIVDVSPFAQVALFTLAGQVLLQRGARRPSHFFAVAILLVVAADVMLSFVIKGALPLNTVMTGSWTAAVGLLVLDAERVPPRPERHRRDLLGSERPDPVPGLRGLPYFVAAGSLALLLYRVHLPHSDVTEQQQGFMISTVILTLLLTRQLLTLLDNQKLSRQLIAANRELHHQATHDGLTGLLNYVGFSGRFEASLKAAQAEGGILSLLALDFDSFKEVNDLHGHLAGDHVLREAGKRIREVLADGQYAARLGGDEFLIVLPGLGRHQAADVADRFVRHLMQPYAPGSGTPELAAGVSVGSSTFPADGTDAMTLVGAADAAMYRAKQRGTGIHMSASAARTTPQRSP